MFTRSLRERFMLSMPAMALAGITAIVVSLIQIFAMIPKAVDLYDCDWNALKARQHINAEIDFLFPTDLYSGANDATRDYYVVPLVDKDSEGYYISKVIFLTHARKDGRELDRIAENSFNWWVGESEFVSSTPKVIDGYLRPMKKDEKTRLRNYLVKEGIDASEVDKVMVPYVLTDIKTERIGVMLILGVVFFTIGSVASFFLYRKYIGNKIDYSAYKGVVIDNNEEV